MGFIENIVIIADTNYFYIDEQRNMDLSDLSLKRYNKIIKSFEFNESDVHVKIFIPELVLRELLSQHKRKLEKEIKNFKKIQKRFLGFNIKPANLNDIDIEGHCNELEEKFLKKLNIINIPDDKEKLFNSIFNMAIEKQPPFLKDDKSDKGFKDSILLCSLLDFAKTSNFDKYILVSSDKGFIKNIPELKDKFEDYSGHNGDKLDIVRGDDFDSWFNEKFGLFTDLRDYLDNIFFKKIDDKYYRASHVSFGNGEIPIEDYYLKSKRTIIYQVDENEFEVEIFLSIEINLSNDPVEGIFYEKNNSYTLPQSESFHFKKTENGWEYKLIGYEYNISYEFWDESFIDDEYP